VTDSEGEPTEESTAPAAPARRPRRSTLHPVRGRWTVVSSVLAVVVAVAVISAAFPTPAAAPAPGSEDGVPIPPAGASSSSAFCSAGTGNAAATTIYLTNSTPRLVTGVMTSIGRARGSGSVPTVHRNVVVPPLGSAAVNPSIGLPKGSNASSFDFAGGGVVATQVVSGPGGWSTAPCATQISSRWAFSGGSTSVGNTLTLALFNPAAPESVVNISFLTSTGMITPQAYQGLVVPPGRLVVENVGSFVQRESNIATFVTAQSGALVSSEFQQRSSGTTGGVSLRLGSPALSTTWRFAQTTAEPGSTVSFDLANPGTTAVTSTISLGLSSGSVVPRHVSIPPLSIVGFVASGASGLPQRTPYSVTVNASAPIVVGRSVLAHSGSPAPAWGSSSGTVTAATHWLVPGPGVVHVPGTAHAAIESLAVANPGPSVAQVEVTPLGRTRPAAMFTVASDEMTVLGPKLVGGLSAYTVSSSQPVNVEEDSRPTGAPGVVSSTGFPFVN
jgi:hypothetical protein